jgi:OmpA-OmpF porin, OOP family
MMRSFFFRALLLLLAAGSFVIEASSQSGVPAYGTIRDLRTGKGLKAVIRYSSMPTGGISGRFDDSTFSFTVFGTAKYQITALADGYHPRTIILDPNDQGGGVSGIQRDILLTPKGGTIRLNHLVFEQGKSAIQPASFAELDELVLLMKENSDMRIRLEGHTDNVGSAAANLKLSQDRVDAVRAYLVSHGVSKKRIETRAFGGTKPLRNELTPEARVQNRRVEIRILKE